MINYEELPSYSKEEILELAKVASRDELCKILYSSAEVDDPYWVQDFLLSYLDHLDEWVVGAAVMALADLARISGLPDSMRVIKDLGELKEKCPSIAGRVQSALDDIEMFI
jgi:hypothetical protein